MSLRRLKSLIDELYSQIMKLDLESMTAAVRALEALAHERTVARLRQSSDDNGSLPSNTLPYDPASVFLLEIMLIVVIAKAEHQTTSPACLGSHILPKAQPTSVSTLSPLVTV
ncbi:hypothetical protein M378DRAFT_12001 [Amanita muscaria Koide BX008]|uniref:Uncharacterized protein n=1 Tax=Amanita muscaria (strain Koide BX008) TaxID=946122 RepID=A0A0C2TAL0_AMAMK|nr:hypothetical protein M378DRAFT_12001 [Amanita muscaria Koide BX008]